MVCENAAKHDHVCMCAMCIHCYNKMQSNEAKHLDKHDDQEMISFLYIFLFYIIHIHAQQQQLTSTPKKYIWE